jgi:hypothetical protein
VAFIRKPSHNRLTWAAIGWFVLAASLARAQEPVKWKSGPAFRQQLDESVGVTWQDRLLRDGLTRLSQTYGVAIFLDRKIDPGQPLTFTFRDQPLETLLKQVAAEAGAGVAILEPVIYMGPPEVAAQLATLAAIRRQDASKLPNDAKIRLLRSQAWQWDELVQPRQLLEELARQANVSVENPAAIPLDLWPAVSLPPLPWTHRLTLLLAGFGLTFEIDERGSSVRLVPQPTSAILEKRYSPRGTASDLATQLSRIMPEAKIKVEQGQLVVAAKQEDHDKIERLLSGQSVRMPKPAKGGGEKLYSLKVANEPAGKVVRKVAESLSKELRYEPAVLEKLKQPVNFNLENATLEHLLETTLKPLGLTYRVTDQTLEITEQK